MKTQRLFSTVPIIKHSVATPLSNILLNAELAVNNLHYKDSEHSYQPLQRVLLNAQYLQTLLTLHEKKYVYIFSPQKALEELLLLNEGAVLKKSLVTRITLPPKTHIVGNKLLFQEMITCLLNNAFESYFKQTPQKMVFLSATQQENFCSFSIVDAGKGMNWWEKRWAFIPFRSLKENHSGLGLSFVKHSLEHDFQGKLQIHSQKNKGTTITLLFPCKRNEAITKTSSSFNH